MQDFTSSDINEAKRRVRQMQQRAKDIIGEDVNESKQSTPDEPKNDASPLPFNISNMFSGEDSSTSIILALVLILSHENADNMLILALLYILL